MQAVKQLPDEHAVADAVAAEPATASMITISVFVLRPPGRTAT
jgi:hypothetical protein